MSKKITKKMQKMYIFCIFEEYVAIYTWLAVRFYYSANSCKKCSYISSISGMSLYASA